MRIRAARALSLLGVCAVVNAAPDAASNPKFLANPKSSSPATSTVELPYNVESPGASPIYVPRLPAVLLPLEEVLPFVGACVFAPSSPLYGVKPSRKRRDMVMERRQLPTVPAAPVAPTSTEVATSSLRPKAPAAPSISMTSVAVATPSTSALTSSVLASSSTTSTITTSTVAAESSAPAPSPSCLGSSATEATINTLFSAGGAGTTVNLCPKATLQLSNPIQLTAAGQTLQTLGLPTGSSRAMLVVTGVYQSNAITTSCAACSNIAIRNIQVNGNRPAKGFISPNAGGSAILEVGGSNTGQLIDHVRAYEPRAWSIIHAIEGNQNSCRNTTISNCELGPAGDAPSGEQQNRLRSRAGYAGYVPVGQWADGISHACQQSTVTGNIITDATDGGIVVFGAPGSTIAFNTIVANTRVAQGGINMVDLNPYAGSFLGTSVHSNTIIANTTMIKIGIASGSMTWTSDNRTADRTSNGHVDNNHFSSGPAFGPTPGYFGFGIAAAGVVNATILSGNVFSHANFAGIPSPSCTSTLPPTPGPMYYDPFTTPGANLRRGFVAAPLEFLICLGPTTNMSVIGYTSK